MSPPGLVEVRMRDDFTPQLYAAIRHPPSATRKLLVLDRVLELQESPCLQGSGIVIAVEGPSSATLLAKHGPLPDRSYICLVRPRRSRGGSANERGGTFDEGYYWHGVGETLAVEEVRKEAHGYGRVI